MIHKSLVDGHWERMTLAEQLGNIGSEFDRVIHAKQKQDQVRQASALVRFLELFDLTLTDKRWTGLRRRELARLRGQCLLAIENNSNDSANGLSRYYLFFGLLARNDY